MATSLEDLLAEEGFRGRRVKTVGRASFGSQAESMPRYSCRDQHKSGSSSGVRKTERAQSDKHMYDLRGESPTNNRVKDRKPKDNYIRREKMDRGSKKENRDKLDRRNSQELLDVYRSSVELSKGFPGNKTVAAAPRNEIGKIRVQDGKLYKDIYSNEVFSPIGKDRHSKEIGEREKHKYMSWKHTQVDKRYGNSSSENLIRHTSFGDNSRKSTKPRETSSSRSNSSSQSSKTFDARRNQRLAEMEQSAAEPALDEAAVRAMISILSGYIKRFLKDEDLRTSLHHSCFASLNFTGLEEGPNTESRVISNLEQAIGIVERAAVECASANELKKASLQLSVITGLNANDMKDGCTSGIPNNKLSACAHLYLSVIYKLQKKDRIAAKHILQMFCDSPFQARTALMPELWDSLFFPHLYDLKIWYDQEADSLADTPSKARKLKLLEKVYHEILDSGTYQFAVYYKDWLTEGVEAPSIPSIQIPSIPVQGVQQIGLNSQASDLGSPLDLFSPQPMVSKKLYDAVFGRLHKPGVDELEDYRGANFDNSIQSSNGSSVEVKQTLTYFSKAIKHEDLHNERDAPEDNLIAEEAWELHREGALGEGNLDDRFDNSHLCQEASESTHLHSLPNTKANVLILQRLAKSVFEMRQSQESADLFNSGDAPYPDFQLTKIRSYDKDLHGIYEFFEGGHFFSSIPHDFKCPLTGLLFEDPVTLETGQNFEREAITEWLNKGNRTCPVTGNTLECLSVPLTNTILKRIVDSWKSERCKHLLDFTSQIAGISDEHIAFKDEASLFILEQLLSVFSREERLTNGKNLVSLGGLQFLLRRFKCGNLEEKTCVAALLSCCIDADSGCRNHISRNIEKRCLLELLQCKDEKSKANAVLLLTELVEPKKYSVYREEAVDAVTLALDSSLADEKVRESCCRALLILGARFSFSGKIMTEDWILKQAGFLEGPESEAFDREDDLVPLNEYTPSDDNEEEGTEDWLATLSASLVGDGKSSFLESLSKCLGSDNSDLVRVCLTTVAWLSSALALLSDAQFQMSAFSALISRLKESLEYGQRVEHKILASMSLLNFSKVPECRFVLMTITEEIAVPLRSLAEVTWTAKELYALLCEEDLCSS
ncbi:hypothetical protein RJ640_015668 [Escallonia rubra]|uniref:RING-type E3 ubiquitin transferase n=1 Tax=Escallonia rubra TaxID=112253 RepID=A0AA88UD49_9ASTE|nr:hypothetical protein RJ640_015668 [Escallonia rubra]